MDETTAIARCEECRELIYNDNDNFYIDESGNYFCCLDCALTYHCISRGENYDGD